MNKDMLTLAQWCVQVAKSVGADDCRVSINSDRLVEISYRERKPENIKEASTKGLYIEVFVNGRYSGQSTSDLRHDALNNFISNAVATTRLLAEDPFRTLPDPKYYQGRADVDLGIFDVDYEKFTPENRHSMVKEIEQACLSKGGDKVISATANVNDGHTESVVLTSNGFEGYTKSTYYVAVAEMTAKDEGDRRPEGYDYAVAVNRKDMPPPAKVGAMAAKRTLDLLGGKKIKTETLPIIIENRSVPRLLGGFLAAMYGRSIQQKQSFLADKKGKKIASDQFTLIDDPFIKGGLGSRLYDGDGFAAKKRVMIEAGVLNKRSVQEIMKDLGRGIFISDFIGGNSNSTTGDASIGIIGQLFENGVPVQAVAEMNIADNHLKFWNRLAEVANDPWMYSSQRMPSLVFTDVVVSGL
ncbi:MAG: TldD/PmbA family protein [bacterium]|nr:TldD/PmbA family protein [bacterium]